MNSENKITAILILEILGRPAEHLVETLEGMIKKMDEEKGVKVVNKTIKEPIELQNQKDFFSSFAEIEVEVESISHVAMLMFKYMPANVQIIEPEKITVDNHLLGDVFSELIRRLHSYDEVARVIEVEKQIMQKKIEELIKEKENSSKDKKSKKK